MKHSHRIVSLVLTIFLFISTISVTASAAERQRKTGIAFVTAGSSLRLRSEPSSSSQTLAYAPKGDVVVLLGKTGKWYKVIYNLQEGYMHSSYLSTATKENAELGYGNVNGSGVNIRSGPGTGYSVLTKAAKNEKVYIIGINETWFKVIFGDYVGYIRSDYVDLTEIPYENAASSKTPLFFVGGKSTGVTPSAAALKAGSVTGAQIVAEAKKYIGVPYLWGGNTPGGFDCSGYVKYVFDQFGITLSRTVATQWKEGTSVSKSSLKLGDLVFFKIGSKVSHVGIYVGNNKFIHASTSKGVVISNMDSSYWSSYYYGARRVL